MSSHIPPGPCLRALSVLFVLCVLGPGEARAQGQVEQVKPYVMLLFDTSGSMIWPVCYDSYSAINGDNSKDCPGKQISCSQCNTFGCGNGKSDDTRLYKVKQGAHSVVSAFGEVTFALSRFRNTPASFTCNASSNSRAGGWQGVACGYGNWWNPKYYAMGSGGNQADVLVSFSDTNQTQILRWMNNCDDYPSVGSCPGSTAPSSGCKLCSDCGGGCDRELRGVGLTPIAGSLYDLRVNYFNKTVLPYDKKKACRPYKVILLTDGQQSSGCTGNPSTEASKLYNNSSRSIPVHVVGFGSKNLKSGLDKIAKAGGTKAAVVVDNELSLALAMASIVSESLMHEKCNGKDDDCDEHCDEDWPEVAVKGSSCKNKHAAKTCTAGQGICKRTGVYVCNPAGTGSVCNVKAGTGKAEICNNNLDDDCDGAVDEGCTPSCVPQVEICDGKDNDCDKLVDEGLTPQNCGSNIGACKYGTTQCSVFGMIQCIGGTKPTKETCDNVDNNCDTIVDNFSVPCYPASTGCTLSTGKCLGNCAIGSKLCSKGYFGACLGYQGPKTEICNAQDDDCDGLVDEGVGQLCINYTTCKAFSSCSVCPAKPTEKCDNIDNDCNGTVDDNVPGVGQTCGTAIGECTKGKLACVKGVLSCSKGKGPTPEICDNKDNDCNGKIDDKVPGDGAACGSSVGECKAGKVHCIGGKWICQGGTAKTAEICDCKDNNCNGQTDEGNPCGAGSKCVSCKCTVPCNKAKEFPCPGGTKCGKDGFCIPDKCNGVKCKATELCKEGKCVSRCLGVTCKTHQTCDPLTGLCADASCKSKGCPKGKVCVGYTCIPDPCPPGKCPKGQMCVNGVCSKPCLNVKCPSGQLCVQGKCVAADPCDSKECPENHVCKVVAGKARCEADPCRVITCGLDQVCYNGKCMTNPCKLTRCPEGLVCKVTAKGKAECIVSDTSKVPTTRRMLASGGGGCSVTGGRDGGPSALLVLLLLVALVRRRVRP